MEIVLKAFRRTLNQMKQTSIVKCPKCAGLMLSSKGQRTKVCTYCGAHLDLTRVLWIASACSTIEASQMLRKLKREQRFKGKH